MFPCSLSEILFRELLFKDPRGGRLCAEEMSFSLCSRGQVGTKLTHLSLGSIPLGQAQNTDTFFPSFLQSWCKCPAHARSLESKIFWRKRGLERHRPHRDQGGRPVGRALICFLSRVVPVFPVLRAPGLQLLAHSSEVFLQEHLQLLPGDAVAVGVGQLVEVLQDLVWETGSREGSVEPHELSGQRPLSA